MSRVCRLLCLAALLCPAAPRLPAQSFRNPLRIPTAQDPSSINVADVNGDGHPDVLYGLATGITQTATGTIHTLLWQPGNTFTEGPTLTLPANANTLCRAGDLNDDKVPDLLCPTVNSAQATTTLIFFPGQGDGSFGTPVYSPVVQPTAAKYPLLYPLLSTFADANRDGHMDVLVTDGQAAVNYTMLGDGQGHFVFGGTAGGSNGVAQLIDVNEDGIPDVVLSTGLIVSLGRGDGTFNQGSTGRSYDGCTYGDLDGDGHVDAACAYAPSDGYGLYILRGKGDGSFNAVSATPYAVNNTEGPALLTALLQVRDINGDGRPDLLGFAGDGWTTILAQPGLTFAAPRHAAAGYVPGALIYSQLYPRYALEDLDGDGRPDLVAAGPLGVYISLSQAPLALTPPEPVVVTEPGYRVGHAAVADFNGDGIPDVAASGSKDLTLSLGKGDGTFLAPVAVANAGVDFSTPTTATGAYLLNGDFDGDGKQDLLAVGAASVYNTQLYLLRGRGDGTFATPSVVPTSGYVALEDRSVFDVDHDGKDDRFSLDASSTKGQPGYIAVSLSNGNGTFRTVRTPVTIESTDSFNRALSFPALADFDGDGQLDAVYAYTDNAYAMPGKGDGTFTPARTVTMPIPSLAGKDAVQVYAVVAGDFDDDGNNDVAVLIGYVPHGTLAVSNSSAVTLFFGKGDGTFRAPVQRQLSHTYTDMLAADLDRDGHADLLLNNWNTLEARAVAVLHGRTDRTLSTEANYYAGGGISTMAVADLNRDGRPDLVFANGDLNRIANTVTVLMNVDAPPVSTGTLVADPEPSLIGQTFDLVATLQPVPATLPSGSVRFQVDGADMGSAALSGYTARITVPGTLAEGTHTLSAIWSGDAAHTAFTLTGSHRVVAPNAVTPPTPPAAVPTQLSLSAQPNPAYQGQQVALRATVTFLTAAGSAPPTGTVQFLDSATLLAQSAVTGGVATLSASSLSVGTHTLSAIYSGDSRYAGSTSDPTTETILPSGFQLSASPATLSLATGHHLTFTVKAESVGMFADTLRFRSADLPAHATLAFTPDTAALPAGKAVSTIVYLDTSDVIGYLSKATPGPSKARLAFAAGLACPAIFLVSWRRRRCTGALLLAALAMFCSAALGCSGKYPASVTPGQYTVHLFATAQGSGTVQTLEIPLTVTP